MRADRTVTFNEEFIVSYDDITQTHKSTTVREMTNHTVLATIISPLPLLPPKVRYTVRCSSSSFKQNFKVPIRERLQLVSVGGQQ